MTQIAVTIPVSLTFELSSEIDNHIERVIMTHNLLRASMVGTCFQAEHKDLKAEITLAKLHHEDAQITYAPNDDATKLTTWNNAGESLDARQFSVALNDEGDKTQGYMLHLSADAGLQYRPTALVSHPAVAEAIGNAFSAGHLNFDPAFKYP